MTYVVEIAQQALTAISDATHFIAVERQAPRDAEAWLQRLWNAIDKLENMPRRCPVDPIQSEALGSETRKLTFGNYLVFFQIDDDRHRVNVVAFIHAAQSREID